MPQTGDFPVETQKGQAVGIQAEMDRKPESATVQEGHDNFDSYKAAGKVHFFLSRMLFMAWELTIIDRWLERRPSSLVATLVLAGLPP
jgi:hypothetical protein